jgi:hypothetical protein
VALLTKLPASAHTLAWQAARAILAGTFAATLAWWFIEQATRAGATDFEFWWRATRLLVAGSDPYAARPNTAGWPLRDRLFYPGPALILTWPFAGLALRSAFVAWSGLGGAVLAWGLARSGRAVLPIILSVPFVVAVRLGQWSPWLTAAALVPAFGAVLAAKPTLGAALFGARPSRAAFIGGVVVVLASLAWLPAWPFAWLENVRHVTAEHRPPITRPLGLVLLLALLRWRHAEARLLLLYACVPQLLLFADQLPLLLVARQRVEALALWGASWIAFAYWFLPLPPWNDATTSTAEPYVLAGVYIPALLLVLRRPNRGVIPEWLEAALVRWRVPSWLRGVPAATGDTSGKTSPAGRRN